MSPPSAFICVYLRFTICKYLKTDGQVLTVKDAEKSKEMEIPKVIRENNKGKQKKQEC